MTVDATISLIRLPQQIILTRYTVCEKYKKHLYYYYTYNYTWGEHPMTDNITSKWIFYIGQYKQPLRPSVLWIAISWETIVYCHWKTLQYLNV